MDATFKVDIDLTHLGALADVVLQNMMQAVSTAVSQTANETATAWQLAIYHAPGVREEGKKAAIDSIKWQMTGSLSALVSSDEKTAYGIEEGFPEYDMKAMLQTSQRTRQTKAGKKYLIIPFRHNTPGHNALSTSMPVDVYKKAKSLVQSSITGKTTRLSATGATVPQSVYQWGGRLPAGLTPKLKPHHTTDIHAGMVRFNTSTGKSKSSAYMTFRVMHEGQTDKWIRRAKPGLHIARDLSQGIEQKFMQNFASQVMNIAA
jgi:hypothetical protein